LNKITLIIIIIIIIIIIGFRLFILLKSRAICGGGWTVAEILNGCLSSVPNME
jgi:hypothetical protein